MRVHAVTDRSEVSKVSDDFRVQDVGWGYDLKRNALLFLSGSKVDSPVFAFGNDCHQSNTHPSGFSFGADVFAAHWNASQQTNIPLFAHRSWPWLAVARANFKAVGHRALIYHRFDPSFPSGFGG
ncbi:MAG: hypothetical protein BWY57_02709 [Betaproteobacteria bacterium ADurb.Bin341]|nr:MAG: hypothetical protein BWY57_02709 [Betaproteobacteria bacterium ADurb.Bin341]